MAQPHPLDLLIRQLAGHGPLDDDDRDAIRALPHIVRSFDAHGYVVREGDAPGACMVLLSGFAYRQKTTHDGARQIVALHIPGDALDLQNLYLDEADHSVQALTRADIACVPRRDFQQLMLDRRAVGRAATVAMLVEASIAREWVLNVGRRNSRTRMAHLLCEFALRLEAQGLAERYGYELPMTQEQLADALGLTPVHVNRTLKALELDGLITRKGRAVAFPDWRRLREAADFNQRYLHLGQQKEAEVA